MSSTNQAIPSGKEFAQLLEKAGNRAYGEHLQHSIKKVPRQFLNADAELKQLPPSVRSVSEELVSQILQQFFEERSVWEKSSCKEAYRRIIDIAADSTGLPLESEELLLKDPDLAFSLYQVATLSIAEAVLYDRHLYDVVRTSPMGREPLLTQRQLRIFRSGRLAAAIMSGLVLVWAIVSGWWFAASGCGWLLILAAISIVYTGTKYLMYNYLLRDSTSPNGWKGWRLDEAAEEGIVRVKSKE